tara:strand:- start:1299 stop:2036 length:738 start_codon:yes stop_codon:yes gene_type:complete
MKSITADKKALRDEFLAPISRVRPNHVVLTEDLDTPGDIYCIAVDEQQNSSLYARHRTKSINGFGEVGLKSCERLIKGLAFVKEDEIELTLEDRHVAYDGPTLKFQTPILAEKYVERIKNGLTPSNYDDFKFDVSFDLPISSIEQIIKGRQFAGEADRLVMFSDGAAIKGRLECSATPTSDNITFELAQSATPLSREYNLSIDTFSLLSVFGEGVQVLLNEDKRGFLFISQSETTMLKYGVRTLV